MKLSALLWAAALIVVNAAAQNAQPPIVGPTPPVIVDAADSLTMYPLRLPAGVSLISAPLDAGSGPAVDAFIGAGSEWPLLFEWDSSTQQFLDPEDSMMSMGAGYWYYSPAPSTLMIIGKPYSVLKHLTKDITPGWHLFGVPFTEGIDWSGFHLYAGGNPIGLETARELGWIGSEVLTMQGSNWQVHPKGAPFQPGAAYWIKTTVPLSVRAEPAPVVGGSTPTPLPPLSKFVKVIENKDGLIRTGGDIAAGKLVTGGLSGSGAVFALANLVAQKYFYDGIMDELDVIDSKVDELLTDMSAIQNQLADVQRQIQSLQDWFDNDATLGEPLRNAEGWLAQYYTDPTQELQSYNWARWQLAGCAVTATECTGTVTDASSQAFANKNAMSPATDPPNLVTDNFYLWWAYAVVGGANGIETYKYNGSTAKNLVQSLHDGMVPPTGTSQNGLLAYMDQAFLASNCANDVTLCDLYAEVYKPTEDYFQQLIATQVALVQAVVEADAALASSHQTHHEYDTAASSYMTSFQKQLSEEAESFVKVAEQIALYRAGDGRFDWSTYGTSDAAQLLARADFVAARLVGTANGTPWPWPPGVTGRIFYTNQQGIPASTTPHKACTGTATCTTFTEATSTAASGGWAYLEWDPPDSNNVVTGHPTTSWNIRRLTPQPMAVGTYQVASMNAQYGNANLVVSQYGDDYSNPPTEGTTPVLFGSFTNVEGSLGIGALGKNRRLSGGGDDSLHNYTITPFSNYVQMNLVYPSSSSSEIKSNWYEDISIYVPDHSLFGTFPKVRVFWPNQVEIVLGQTKSGTYVSDCTLNRYQSLQQTLHMLQSSGTEQAGVAKTWTACGTDSLGFASCNSSSPDRNGTTLLASAAVTLDHSKQYKLEAHFADAILGYYQIYKWPVYWPCVLNPTAGSHVNWNVYNPTVVLVK